MIFAAWLQVGWVYGQTGPVARTPVVTSVTSYFSLMTMTTSVTVSGLPDASFSRHGYPSQAFAVYRDLKEYVDSKVAPGMLVHLCITTVTETWQRVAAQGKDPVEILVGRSAPQIQRMEWTKE